MGYSDLKLTLCSALLNPEGTASADDFVFIDNVPMSIRLKEATSCRIKFGPAKALRNDMKCKEEAQLAVNTESTFVPRCKKEDRALYELCQCDVGTNDEMAKCWCSDELGNILGNDTDVVQIPKDGQKPSDYATWDEVCSKKMKCAVADDDEAATASLPASDVNDKLDALEWTTAAFAIGIAFALMCCAFIVCTKRQKYQKVVDFEVGADAEIESLSAN